MTVGQKMVGSNDGGLIYCRVDKCLFQLNFNNRILLTFFKKCLQFFVSFSVKSSLNTLDTFLSKHSAKIIKILTVCLKSQLCLLKLSTFVDTANTLQIFSFPVQPLCHQTNPQNYPSPITSLL
jgi:hypothetical protein